MRTLIGAACLLGLVVASCGPQRQPTARKPSTPTVGYPSAEAIITFCQPVDYPENPPPGYVVVEGRVAIPVTTPDRQPLQVSRGDFDQAGRWYFDDHGGWLWAKSGLLVWGSTEVEVSAPLDIPLRFDWGEGPNLVPRRSLRVECSQKTPKWMALIGGYFATTEGCFPLAVRVGGRPIVQVHVQMGARCLGGVEPSALVPLTGILLSLEGG